MNSFNEKKFTEQKIKYFVNVLEYSEFTYLLYEKCKKLFDIFNFNLIIKSKHFLSANDTITIIFYAILQMGMYFYFFYVGLIAKLKLDQFENFHKYNISIIYIN